MVYIIKMFRSIFITHQLLIKTPFGEKILHGHQLPLHKQRSMNAGCLILSGMRIYRGLYRTLVKNRRTSLSYIGPLSRFSLHPWLASEKHVLILISGPEPQRTIFEKACFCPDPKPLTKVF
jgi:hypothetical protein